MKNLKQVFVVILLIILTFAPITNGISAFNSNHIIAGYGPLKGDIYSPRSIQIKDNKVYILDQFGLSVYDQQSRNLLNQWKIELQREDPLKREKFGSLLEDPEIWKYILNRLPDDLLTLISPSGSGDIGFYSIYSFQKDMRFNSKGELLILDYRTIKVINPIDGTLIRNIMLDSSLPDEKNDDSFYQSRFRIYNDRIYLLRFKNNFTTESTASIYILDHNGKIENKIDLHSKTLYKSLLSGFIFLPEIELFCISSFDVFSLREEPIEFFDIHGDKVECNNKIDSIIVFSIANNGNNSILLAGRAIDEKEGNITTHIHEISCFRNNNGKIDIQLTKRVTNDLFGWWVVDLVQEGNITGIITTSKILNVNCWDYRIITLKDNSFYRYGSNPDRDGQILGSIAFTTDDQGNLFTSNLTDFNINKFDKFGEQIFTLNFKQEELINHLDTDYLGVFDLAILKDDLFLLTDIGLIKYSISENNWENVASSKYNNYISCQTQENSLFLLDSTQSKFDDFSPNLLQFSDKSDIVNIQLTGTPDNIRKQPFYVGFAVTEKEYLVLDSVNQVIYVYSRENNKYLESINLPNSKKSFYSSIAIYPDGSILVADVTQSRLLHVTRKGELVEKIGEKGEIVLNTTKEAYLEKTDQFFGPFRAKIANGMIYVTDLFNCRYHIISLTKNVNVDWVEKDIKIDKYSVFENREVEFTMKSSEDQSIPFTVTSTTPWIQIQKPNGIVSDRSIKVFIIGDKLFPWDFNAGKIKVFYPDYPESSTELRILINYVTGNIVKVTIGSSQATLNDQEITLDPASVPMLKQGRTFVGIRLMGEMVFSNTAKISFDAKTQTVYFEIGSKKIELYVGKQYALVNGTKVPLDAPPFIQAGRTFVPLRFVSENLDASVDYNAKAQSITITYPKRK